jgi:hypothetical protein
MFLDIKPCTEPLPDKEWQQHLDVFLEHKKLNPEIIEFLSYEQTYVIKEIHKSFNRIKNRNARKTTKDTE